MVERPGVSRRDVAKGVAWALPAVTVVASTPAVAASQPCKYTNGLWQSGGSTTAVSGTGMTATATANGGTRIRGENFTLVTISNGSEFSGQSWLMLSQGGSNAAGQTVTVTFPQPVYCVRFYVNDIDTHWDTASSHLRDQITVSGFTASTSSSEMVVSGGTATPAHDATNVDKDTWTWDNVNSSQGLAKFSAAGPMSSLTLTFANINPGGGTGVNNNWQQAYVSPIAYSTAPCNCL